MSAAAESIKLLEEKNEKHSTDRTKEVNGEADELARQLERLQQEFDDYRFNMESELKNAL